jgi:hypothetical protein
VHLWHAKVGTFRLQTRTRAARIICSVSTTTFAPETLRPTQALRLCPLTRREQAPPVLVAGGDPAERAAVLTELALTLPAHTRFEEAAAFWEVLALAPTCRLVLISGDLRDGAAEALAQTLGQRHPGLPVVSLKTAPLAEA